MGTVLGTVSCPCKNSAGKAMTETEALRSIVGQVASMRLPWATAICKKRDKGVISQMEALWNSKVTLATVQMYRCWMAKCSAVPEDTTMDLQDLLLKGRYADLDLGDKLGAAPEALHEDDALLEAAADHKALVDLADGWRNGGASCG